jgi:hypothetical protein
VWGGAKARRRKYWVYFEILFRCVGRAASARARARARAGERARERRVGDPPRAYYLSGNVTVVAVTEGLLGEERAVAR